MSSSKSIITLRHLGKNGPEVPALGYGAMGLSAGYYTEPNDTASKPLLQAAVKEGCVFWDTANIYGGGHNEELIGTILKEVGREKVFICTKFGYVIKDGAYTLRGDREFVRQCCDESLKRLGVDYIDLYYAHRLDPQTPVEETVSALKELKEAGKIKAIGLSECSVQSLQRALKVVHIDAVQIEYSPWETGVETSGLLDVMRENGVALVAYAPLGRGMLTGQLKSLDELAPNDFRRTDPRLQGENFTLNKRVVDKICELAAEKSKAIGVTVTPAAFTLAWILYQGSDFFVIPGTTSLKRLEENLTAAKVLETFTKEDDEAVRKVVEELNVHGERYMPEGMKLLNL